MKKIFVAHLRINTEPATPLNMCSLCLLKYKVAYHIFINGAVEVQKQSNNSVLSGNGSTKASSMYLRMAPHVLANHTGNPLQYHRVYIVYLQFYTYLGNQCR